MRRGNGKSEVLEDFLRERISVGEYAPGDKIPSIRELRGRFGLSFTTAKKGVDRLCELGVLEKRPRSGVYVSKRNAKPAGSNLRIAVISSHGGLQSSHGVYSTVFLGAQRFAEENDVSLILSTVRREIRGSECGRRFD